MNKLSTLSLAVIATLGLGLSGCGSSSSSSATPSFFSALVSRGDVYGAKVTDSASPAHVAVQVEGKNEYRFDVPKSEIVFPIVANGGYIDVDDNGKIEAGVDTKLTVELKSYDGTVTPVSTYIADLPEIDRDAKLQELVDLVNASSDVTVTADDLLKPANETNFDAAVAINAVFEELVKYDGSSFDLNDVNGSYNTIKTEVKAQYGANADAVDLEKFTMADLGMPTLSTSDIEDFTNSMFSTSVDKLKSVTDLQGKTVYTIDKDASPVTFSEIKIPDSVGTDTKLDVTTYELNDGEWVKVSANVEATATLDARSDELTLVINDGEKEVKNVIDGIEGNGTELKTKLSFKNLTDAVSDGLNANASADVNGGFSSEEDGAIYLEMTAEMKSPELI